MASANETSVLYRLKNLKDHSTMSIYKDRFTIGRVTTNDLAIGTNRFLSSSHCLIQFDRGHVFIQDTSSNGTLINRTKKIHKNETPFELQSGDIIHLVFRKDEPQENLVFQLDLPAWTSDSTLKRKHSDHDENLSTSINDTKENADLSNAMDTSIVTKESPRSTMQEDMADVLTCACCQDLMNDPICLEPCLHAFCKECYTSWEAVQRTCPTCRVKVVAKKKNVMINSILDAYLKANPHKRPILTPIDNQTKVKVQKKSRSNTRTGRRAAKNTFQAQTAVIQSHRVAYNDESDDDDEANVQNPNNQMFVVMSAVLEDVRLVCRECPSNNLGVATNQFQCSTNQHHILCQCCAQAMPDRQDTPGIHQSCELCHQNFCHLYYEKCQADGCLGCLNQLRNFDFSPRHLINFVLENPIETEIVQRYLVTRRMSMRDFLLECCQRLDAREFRSPEIERNTTVPSKKILCYRCALKIFKQLAYQFRVAMRPTDILPVSMRHRDDCYYGKECRTQYTKSAHAQKFNHACEQTRFD